MAIEGPGGRVGGKNEKIQAGSRPTGFRPSGGVGQELAPKASSLLRGMDVQIIDECTVLLMFVKDDGTEAEEMAGGFREHNRSPWRNCLQETGFPFGTAFGDGLVIEILIAEDAAIGGLPTGGMQGSDCFPIGWDGPTKGTGSHGREDSPGGHRVGEKLARSPWTGKAVLGLGRIVQ